MLSEPRLIHCTYHPENIATECPECLYEYEAWVENVMDDYRLGEFN